MIKFGEKFAVTLISIITVGFYAEVFLLSARGWLVALPVLFFAALLYGVVTHSNIRRLFWPLYVYIQVGLMALFLVVEWRSAHLLVATLAFFSAVAVTLWSRRVSAPIVFVREKPLRRAITVLLALAVFSYVAAVHAVLILFADLAAPLLMHFVLAAVVALGTYLLWSLYYQGSGREFLIPLGVVFLFVMEGSIIAALGSTGYFIRAFGLGMLWYVMQLFIRFHFGNRDIIWPRQKFFLASTTVVFVVFVFLIRFL